MLALRKLQTTLNYKKTLLAVLSLLLGLSLSTIYYVNRTIVKERSYQLTLAEKEFMIASISARAKGLLLENQRLMSDDARAQLNKLYQTVEKYEVIKEKTAAYKSDGVNVKAVENQLPKVVDLIFSKDYSAADTQLSKLDKDLETALKVKQAADTNTGSSTTTSCNSIPSAGYCQTTVSTSAGSFGVFIITANLNSTTVITDTANSSNCANNCPTKSLQTFISSKSGFAGIHGTYFCPPDYASCASKKNSFDFPVYNSSLKKWINEGNLSWNDRAMMAFTSSGAVFYPQANTYSGLSGLKAAIVNHPGLVHNGVKIVGNYPLTSAQNTKGYRGGVGVKGNTIYLVIAQSATVVDLANIMISLGMTQALNLDGGGSSALYRQGSYKVGPGRSLPNALILK